MAIEELEQIWNNEDAVATIVVILEYWQRKIRARYLEYYDM